MICNLKKTDVYATGADADAGAGADAGALPARVRARLVEMAPLKITVNNLVFARTRVHARVRVRLVETQLYTIKIKLYILPSPSPEHATKLLPSRTGAWVRERVRSIEFSRPVRSPSQIESSLVCNP